MVAGLLDVIRHHVFKGEHPLHVEIAGAGDEVLLIGILTAELIADEMAAVVQVLAIHDVIFHRLPAAGLDLADAVPFLRGHQVLSDAGIGRPQRPNASNVLYVSKESVVRSSKEKEGWFPILIDLALIALAIAINVYVFQEADNISRRLKYVEDVTNSGPVLRDGACPAGA